MDDDENLLLRYLVEVDTPNNELIDDDDEEVDAMVAAIDAHCSYHRLRRSVLRERADGEARIIRHYFAENPIFLPKHFRRSRVYGNTK
jgi:hypothetical protein